MFPRIFGKPKEAAPAPAAAAAPFDFGAAGQKLEARLPGLKEKVADIDKQLIQLRGQFNASKMPAQKEQIKQRMLMHLKRKQQYLGQMSSIDKQAFNLSSGEEERERALCICASGSLLTLPPSHHLASSSLPPSPLLSLPLSPSLLEQWRSAWRPCRMPRRLQRA